MDKKPRFQDRYTLQRIEDCRRIYARYGGRQHELIEREMRRIGHHSFHRRLLYSRFERGRHAPGWVEKYKFNDHNWTANDSAASMTNPGQGELERNGDFGQELRERSSQPRLQASETVRDSPAAFETSAPGTDSAASSAANKRRMLTENFDEFRIWLKRVSPHMDWDFKHQVHIYKQLRRFEMGLCDRMMLFIPPRHGKSELVTVHYTAWALRNDPAKNVVIASYSQTLANRFSRKIKGVLANDWALTQAEKRSNEEPDRELPAREYSSTAEGKKPQISSRSNTNGLEARGPADGIRPYENGSPFPFASKRRANTDAEWETSHGGGLRAVGVGGGITGFGADMIVVDDPIKSRAEAESATYRDRVWNWFNDDIYTRLEPNGKVCIIQTRWHEDDLCGRLLRESAEGGEHWEVIDLPALAEGQMSEPPAAVGGNEGAVPSNVSATDDTAGEMSLKGTQTTAQGKASGRNPGSSDNQISDPEGVERPSSSLAPLQGAKQNTALPGVPPKPLHSGIFSSSPSATSNSRVIGFPRLYSKLSESTVVGGDLPEPSVSPGGTNVGFTDAGRKSGRESFDFYENRIEGVTSTPPAIAGGSDKTDRGDPLGRKPGEALWPERFSAELLCRIKLKLGSYSFGALYQQRPVPADGGLFKREWFKIIPRAPHGLRWRRATDPGLTSNAKADYTASFRVAFDRENNLYIDGGFRKQLEYPDLRRFVLGRMLKEHDTLEHVIERSAHGRALEQDLGRERSARGKPLLGVDVRDGKVPRALPWIALAEQGKVFLTRAAWNRDFIDECLAFPLGTHDDQIDAVSLGVGTFRRLNNTLHRF